MKRQLLTFVFIGMFFTMNAQWVQKGDEILGANAFYHAGSSVGMSDDGDIIAIGTPKESDLSEPGLVTTMIWNGTSWDQRGQTINGNSNSDQFGKSVALSSDGNTMIVGAPQVTPNISINGYAKVYSWDGAMWVDKGSVIESEADLHKERFGTSVSISADGSIVAIGGPGADDTNQDSGVTRIYYWNDSTWVKRGDDLEGDGFLDESGATVSLSSDGLTVAIGASWNDNGFANAGQAKIFHWDGTSWTLKGSEINGQATLEAVGLSVSMDNSGDVVAIGGGNFVRVYEYIEGVWSQQGADIVGEMFGDIAGYASLSGDGSVVAIGAPFNDGVGLNAGNVRIFERTLGGDWIQSGNDINASGVQDNCGSAICLSDDGHTVAVGSPDNFGNNQQWSGQVRVFEAESNVGIYELQNLSTLVFPNPNDGSFTIQAKDGISKYTIYSIEGKLIRENENPAAQKVIRVSNMKPGIYIVNLSTLDNKYSTVRLVVY